MKKRQQVLIFFSGFAAALLVVGLMIPAVAAMAGKTIQVYTGIDVYVNDQKLDPRDANGNPVEVFVYNGTTYLPIRAIGNALGLPVSYDAATTSAYVGRHASDMPSVYLSQLDYFSGTADSGFRTAASEQDNTGAAHYYCITDSFSRTYLVNGQYSALGGTLYQTYDYRSYVSRADSCLEIYGDGRLLYSCQFEKGQTGIDPVEFYVDITGVLKLEVVFSSSGNRPGNINTYPIFSLGEAGLYS